MESINIYLVHDTILSNYETHDENFSYINTKNEHDKDFIIWLCILFYKIKKNCNINISINNYSSQLKAGNFNKIEEYISKNVLYYPIDKKNYVDVFFDHIYMICTKIYQEIWNVHPESKNLILIYTENFDVIYNSNVICNQKILKKIDEFYIATIGYIVKLKNEFYFVIYNNRIKYISNQLYIYKNKINYEFINELNLFIDKLLEDIKYKQKN